MQMAPVQRRGRDRSPTFAADLESVDVLGVLAFCTWPQRAAAPALCTAWRSTLGLAPLSTDGPIAGDRDAASGYWRFLCERLVLEHQLYVPGACDKDCAAKPPHGVARSWRELFKELYKLKVDVRAKPHGEFFSMNVAVRFRGGALDSSLEADGIVLPLHQKTRLLRQRLGCSAAEALAIIMRERAQGPTAGRGVSDGDALFLPCVAKNGEDKENVLETSRSRKEKTPNGTNVKDVIDRDGMAEATDARCSILSVDEGKSNVLAVTRQSGLREFSFDGVFSDAASQHDVYERVARRLVMDFLNGNSAGIICYGQTGSGKTHTMFGSSSLQSEMRGVVPRAFCEVLGAVDRWRESGRRVELGVSYVEVFGSEVSDLLREGRVVGQGFEGRYDAVRATDRVGHRYVLDGHTEWPIESWEDVQTLLRVGEEAKRCASTAMNDRSTRAHTVLIMSLKVADQVAHPEENERGDPLARVSRFFFADLGGSEQISKSLANAESKAPVTVVGGVEQSRLQWAEYYEHRERMQETLHINKGLFSLKRVIDALHQRSRLSREGVSQHALPYVPYQDSKLTMILQEALGGSARTLLVAAASMDAKHASESLQTLRFAETCSQVQKRHRVDEGDSIRLALEQIAEEVQFLEAEIVKKERWETLFLHRQDVDTVCGAFGEGEAKVFRQELVPQTVLVGAEAEREQLEHLLERQAELQGLCSVAGLCKDYRELMAKEAADGGRGVDFRHRVRFSARTKAKDFEDENVLADALRYFFRSATGASSAFGEKTSTVRRRLAADQMPAGYFRVAAALRENWERMMAEGTEQRSFGKYMLDRCQAWREIKKDPVRRDAALQVLLRECGVGLEAASSGTC